MKYKVGDRVRVLNSERLSKMGCRIIEDWDFVYGLHNWKVEKVAIDGNTEYVYLRKGENTAFVRPEWIEYDIQGR
jgi:hypothetical protein